MRSQRRHPNHCRICGRHKSIAGHISARGKCRDCGDIRLHSNISAMRSRSGPEWAQWRKAMAACVGGRLLDDGPAEQ